MLFCYIDHWHKDDLNCWLVNFRSPVIFLFFFCWSACNFLVGYTCLTSNTNGGSSLLFYQLALKLLHFYGIYMWKCLADCLPLHSLNGESSIPYPLNFERREWKERNLPLRYLPLMKAAWGNNHLVNCFWVE